MTEPETPWAVASATTIGAHHVAEHLPLQDSVRSWAADDGSAAVVVVADGHGHRAHFRSDVGADLATSLTLEALRSALQGGVVDPFAVGVEAVAGWRREVLEHVEAHPLRSDEQPRGPLVPYGTTLLAVAVTAERLFALQVGDGDTVVVGASGRAWRPLPEDPSSSDGVHTASLCQPDPVASLRTAVVDLAAGHAGDPVVLAYVCTDGMGKGRVDHLTWWSSTGHDLMTTARSDGLDALRARLPHDVLGPARAGGDDTTIAVVVRTPSTPVQDGA